MAVNYKNSAGTDLDNLFYTDNGNAGAVGFKNSAGTDLGNLFTANNTLGYTVGYKNSAGTDLGNLRGDSSIQTNWTAELSLYSGGQSGYGYLYSPETIVWWGNTIPRYVISAAGALNGADLYTPSFVEYTSDNKILSYRLIDVTINGKKYTSACDIFLLIYDLTGGSTTVYPTVTVTSYTVGDLEGSLG